MRDINTKTGATKPASSPFDMLQTETPKALRQIAENGAVQAKENFAKMSAAAAVASNLMQTSCATTAKGAMEYNAKVIEIASANTNAAFEFARNLHGAKSPSEFLEMTTEHMRKRFEAFSEQTKELASLAQKVAGEAAEPLKAGVTKAFQGYLPQMTKTS
jgi:phasin